MESFLWNIGIKVQNLTKELERSRKIGAKILLCYSLNIESKSYDLALIQLADKYIIMGESLPYERLLEKPLNEGCAHVVYAVEDFEKKIRTAIEAGATLIGKPFNETSPLGKRRVALFKTPGGMLLEYIQIITNLVPEI